MTPRTSEHQRPSHDAKLSRFAVVLLACGAAVYTINRPKH